MESADKNAQLATAEKWLSDFGNNATLLLALGRICINLKLWGKAQNYLEASLGLENTPQTCLELANLYQREELNEQEKACELYARGLKLCQLG